MNRFTLGPKKNIFINDLQQNQANKSKAKKDSLKLETESHQTNTTEKQDKNLQNKESKLKNNQRKQNKVIKNEDQKADIVEEDQKADIVEDDDNENEAIFQDRSQLQSQYQAAYEEHQILIKELSQLMNEQLALLNTEPPEYISPKQKLKPYKSC